MDVEREFQNVIYDSDRAIDLGNFTIDPATGWGLRKVDNEMFHLPPDLITILRILDTDERIDTTEIATLFDQTKEYLNPAMLAATSSCNEKCKSYVEQLLIDLDDIFSQKHQEPINASEDAIRVQIMNLRKRIGYDAIESGRWRGYRLAK